MYRTVRYSVKPTHELRDEHSQSNLRLHLAFLDTNRDPDVWAKTKSGAEKAGASSIDVRSDIAKGVISPRSCWFRARI